MVCNSPTLYSGEYSREVSAAQALYTVNIFLPTLEQAAVTTCIREEYFARHIRRMRVLYEKQGTDDRDMARKAEK